MKKEIEHLYEKIEKTNYLKNIEKNIKYSQEILDEKWNTQKKEPYFFLYSSQRVCNIIKKTQLLLSCDELKNNQEKILEVLKLMEEEYYENKLDSDEILFEKMYEILLISSLCLDTKKLEKVIELFNDIFYDFIQNLILVDDIESVNKFIENYFLVKLEIIYEIEKTGIINSKDQAMYIEVLNKIPTNKLNKIILDLGILFDTIGVFKLNRSILFLISKQIMKIAKEEYSFDEYSEAVYIYEKNRTKYTFKRKILDLYCGFGEHPVKILKIGICINIIFVAIYFLNYISNLGIFELKNISYTEKNMELFVDILYFNITTMFTVGYGDIYPLNLITKILVMFQQILGFVFTTSFITLFLRKLFRY